MQDEPNLALPKLAAPHSCFLAALCSLQGMGPCLLLLPGSARHSLQHTLPCGKALLKKIPKYVLCVCVYLKGGVTERDKETSSVLWMAAMAWAKSDLSQEHGIQYGFRSWVSGAQVLGPSFIAFPGT